MTTASGIAALSLLLSGLATSTQASQAINVHVNVVAPDKDGRVIVILDTARTGQPACAVSNATFSINTATTGGQAMLSAIYTAVAADLAIDVVGAGTCMEYSNTESIGYVSLHRRGA